jgi:Tol biopolymer transport system component
MALRRTSLLFLLGILLAGCSNPDAAAAPRRRAVRSGGALLGPPRPVRVSPVPAHASIVYHRQGLFFVMDADGANETQITFDQPRVWEHVAVSFDGRFAVANEQLPNPSGEPGGFSKLWIFDLQDGTMAQLLPSFATAGNGGVDWDREGFIYFAAKQINPVSNPQTPDDFRANAGANDIYRIRYDGTGLQRLLHTPLAGEADVSISEDGSLIAYVSQPVDVSPSKTEIWVMNADGTNRRLVFAAGEVRVASAHDPETSPDNRMIVFSIVNSTVPPNFPQNPDANTAHDIWQMNLDGSEAVRLTRPGPISIAPDWKGDRILYLDISESDRYAGASLVRPAQTEQAPHRIREDANIAKWIPTRPPSPTSVTIRGDSGDAMEPFWRATAAKRRRGAAS